MNCLSSTDGTGTLRSRRSCDTRHGRRHGGECEVYARARMARSSLLWNAICTVSGGLVVVLAAAEGPSSIARSAGEPVRIHARLSQGANPPLLQLEGTQDGRKSDRFAIQGTLAGLP